MGDVGLLYVGAVLFINGLMLLGKVDATAAAMFNLFVGALQVITPTVLIFTADGDTDVILDASGHLPVRLHLPVRRDRSARRAGHHRRRLLLAVRGHHGARVLVRELPVLRRPAVRGHLALLGVPVVPVLPAARV